MTSRLLSSARAWLGTMPALLLLAACAVPTPYQAADGGYGYRDQQIEDKRYRVTFEGNSLTERSDVQNFLLYRAAELTVQNGYDYFTVVDRDLERSTRYYSSGYVDDFYFPGAYRGPSRLSAVYRSSPCLRADLSGERVFKLGRHRHGQRRKAGG